MATFLSLFFPLALVAVSWQQVLAAEHIYSTVEKEVSVMTTIEGGQKIRSLPLTAVVVGEEEKDSWIQLSFPVEGFVKAASLKVVSSGDPHYCDNVNQGKGGDRAYQAAKGVLGSCT
tara:strand:+ start:313 stop:663 length:351 start_codon:yes stop_codon:yes gene_type:complete